MFYSILRGPPYECQVEDDPEGGLMVAVPIARDHREERIVSVVNRLVETVIDDIFWEFSFSIAVVGVDDTFEPFETQDRQMAAGYIPDGVRSAVMQVVCAGLRALIQHANPELTYWVTKDRHPPDKALPKYHMLRETLYTAGYSDLEQGTDPFGRRFWTMRRNAD